MKNNVFRSLLILCFVMLYSFSEAQSISGTVSDESGPLPGATVIVKGTTNGTTTDFDGKYSINVGNLENKLLVFSSLGYKTVSVKLNTDNQLVDMVLQEDLLSLDEVIITGTSGIATKKQLGSAITSITADDLSDSKAIVSVGEALQGQVAGAYISRNSGNPSGGMSIRLRGASTLSGSSDPLYIIDGVVVNNRSNQAIDLGGYTQNRLVDINPNDIERIEILKGAAAAAIYGSRAQCH